MVGGSVVKKLQIGWVVGGSVCKFVNQIRVSMGGSVCKFVNQIRVSSGSHFFNFF